ncbi:diguanylate cyclase [Pseudoalteromonas sp. NEC-BIFX-2020_002]|uniref:sensor domain-containing diguanylate cyclase n=1 Tax=Pseudoalteromonas TaxID=53246 RepID=UPI0006BAC3D5|nr:MULTISPECIES: diguanylate cyclase [Pseudoalteromonas]NNG42601.1 diguanylate cyclase [Pseudoalteromonas sp. NEC-BIFX-2020_002]
MKCAWLFFGGFTLLLISVASHAKGITLDKHFKHLQDISFAYTQQPLTPEQAKLLPAKSWQQLNQQSLNLGIANHAVWIKFIMTNAESYELPALLSIDNPLLDKVTVFHYHKGSTLLFKEIGDALPLDNRQIKNESLLVKLSLPPLSSSEVFLRVETKGGVRVPISVWQHDEYLKYKSKFNLLYGLLIGFVLSLAITCFVLFGFSRKSYFALSGCILITLWLQLVYLYGFGYRYFHPSIPSLQQLAIPCMLIITTGLFQPLFNRMRQSNKSPIQSLQRWSNHLLLSSLLVIWLLPTSLLVSYTLIASSLIMLIHCTAIVYDVKQSRSHPTSALLCGAISFFAALVYLNIVVFGLFDFNTRGLPFMFISFLVCALSLSFATIKYFLIERDAQIASQQARIAQSEAQDALLQERIELQEQAHLDLEANIEERTFELQVTLRELEEKNRALEQMNMEDALTQVKNRRYFDKKLVMDLRRSRREQTPLSVIMFDIDHFKKINDTYGHLTGDQAIQAVAQIIKSHLKRPLDEVARYGGEEFVVLLPNTPLDGALEIAQNIRQAIMDAAIKVASTEIKFTISAGVYCAVAEDINNPGLFTDCADKALYHAKQSGRNRVVSFPILD